MGRTFFSNAFLHDRGASGYVYMIYVVRPHSKLIDIKLEPLDGQEQLLYILQSYFRNAATYYPNAADAGRTTYFFKVGMDFMDASAFALSGLKPTFPLFSRQVNLIQFIASCIRDFRDDLEASPTPDYLFFVSFTYVYGPLLRESGRIVISNGNRSRPHSCLIAVLLARQSTKEHRRCIPQPA